MDTTQLQKCLRYIEIECGYLNAYPISARLHYEFLSAHICFSNGVFRSCCPDSCEEMDILAATLQLQYGTKIIK